MSDIPSIVMRSINDAAAASARLVERCADYAIAQLQAEETQCQKADQRRDIADAWRELQGQRRNWMARLPPALKAAFIAAASGEQDDGAPRGLRPSSLTLVDDQEIALAIESSRLAQQLMSMLDRPLAELNALMSSALMLEGIQPERNPLRPDLYAKTLRRLMGESTPQPGWPGMWLRHMVQPMAEELEKLYKTQAQVLTQAKVQAAGYRLVNTPSARASQFGGLPGEQRASQFGGLPGEQRASQFGGLPGESSAAPLSQFGAMQVNAAVVQDFMFRGGGQMAAQPLAPTYYQHIERELAELQARQVVEHYDEEEAVRYAHLSPVDRPQREVGTDKALPEAVWGEYSTAHRRALVRNRLRREARQLGQALGMEVVRKLVNEVAQDPRLLAPVREAIVGLEPSLLRLALVSPRFFSDEKHPGRMLIESVASRSFKYNDEFSPEFSGFFEAVAEQFNQLNHIEQVEDAQPFVDALQHLEAGWSAEDAVEEQRRQQLLEAVQSAERRQAEADRIASELRLRSDLEGVPEPISNFVLGPWALVLAHARLHNPRKELDPGGYVAVVADLLWSVRRELTLRDPARAFVVIPHVLVTLRKGLDMLGHRPGEHDRFFHHLEKLHRPVLKLRAKLRRQSFDSLGADLVSSEDQLPDSVPFGELPDQLWMAPDELQAAGFGDTLVVPREQEAAEAQPELDEQAAETILATLAEGDWVDLYVRMNWRRARLAWLSGKGTLFMFVSHGGLAHSMTRRSLERLIRDHMLRPVPSEAVVPRALDAVAREARQAREPRDDREQRTRPATLTA